MKKLTPKLYGDLLDQVAAILKQKMPNSGDFVSTSALSTDEHLYPFFKAMFIVPWSDEAHRRVREWVKAVISHPDLGCTHLGFCMERVNGRKTSVWCNPNERQLAFMLRHYRTVPEGVLRNYVSGPVIRLGQPDTKPLRAIRDVVDECIEDCDEYAKQLKENDVEIPTSADMPTPPDESLRPILSQIYRERHAQKMRIQRELRREKARARRMPSRIAVTDLKRRAAAERDDEEGRQGGEI